MATLKNRRCLNKEGSKKCTIHVELDLKGSDIEYRPGDSIGIFPKNHQKTVERTLKALNASGEELITSRDDEEMTLGRFLSEKANIQRANKKSLLFLTLKLLFFLIARP